MRRGRSAPAPVRGTATVKEAGRVVGVLAVMDKRGCSQRPPSAAKATDD
jgi:hypothetical protein